MNLSVQQIQQWLPGSRLIGDGSLKIARVHTDSRSVQAHDLFVVLQGKRFDAHDFLAQLPALGVQAAIATRGLAQAGLSGLEVDDTLQALQSLASAWRAQFDLPLIAVTGSNGKTTVTQMLASILHAWQGEHALATQGNFNNHIGVPLTLLRLRAQHRVAVLELGMNHADEIAQLAACAAPTVALVNNAQREHQEFMHSVQAVAEENGAVIQALPQDGTAVFPAADPYQWLWRQYAGSRRVIDFGAACAQVKLLRAEWSVTHWQIELHTPSGALNAQLHLPGQHNVHNAMAAVAAALAAGAPVSAIAQGLTQFQPVNGRSKVILLQHQGRSITLVDDSYNANPDSVHAAIDVLAQSGAPRLLVLGDMGEAGTQGAAFHSEAGAYARQQQIEHVLTLGELSLHTASACSGAVHCQSMDELQQRVNTLLPAVSTVLVKGSRFMRMERVVQALQDADKAAASLPRKEASCC
ncbi:MAG: UDP-N-acetylmuramoyl-tripeptide--D-alanyl-D-alanine ligase [Limnohabitans sp.]|nr:UDP-N-acetylmuramoyl-tripeptide--D-alanyl-D-alanine ligase [Limnohabitans sp.]